MVTNRYSSSEAEYLVTIEWDLTAKSYLWPRPKYDLEVKSHLLVTKYPAFEPVNIGQSYVWNSFYRFNNKKEQLSLKNLICLFSANDKYVCVYHFQEMKFLIPSPNQQRRPSVWFLF